MPTKHVIKRYDAPAFYHIYNRASGERSLLRDSDDRAVFLQLLQKHLAENRDEESEVKTYLVEVVAYCLMGTHFHLLLYQGDVEAISGYMRSVGTSYSMYYNKKYKSKGHVFQSSFRASHIDSEAYLAHITRYIHLNPHRYTKWRWSSYRHYIGLGTTSWVHADRVGVVNQTDQARYMKFVDDYAAVDLRRQKTELTDYLAL
ncbi:MAG: transposase [Candidatus Saccharimonas sp.]